MKSSTCNRVLFVLAAALSAMSASAKPGLLLAAHGSPSEEWNKSVMALGAQVAEKAAGGAFGAVRTAMMESVQPDIPSMLSELEAEGCERIIVVPLFIAPSGHTHFDLPAILGIYGSAETRQLAKEEGAAIAVPKVPIVVAPTISESDLLLHYALEEARTLSKAPEEEALVLLAHGDAGHEGLVDDLMRRVATYVCGKTGITYANWGYVAVGQSYRTAGVETIHAAGQERKRVLVVGLYTALTAESLHKRSATGSSAEEMYGASEVVFSAKPLIAFPPLVDWVLQTATAALP